MKKTLKIVGIIFVIIILLIGAIIAFTFLGSAGAGKAADKIVEQLQQGDVASIYEQSAFPEEGVSLEEFEDFMGLGEPYDLTQRVHLSWNERGFENANKYVSGNFKLPNGEESMVTFWFQKRGGQLKLVAFNEGGPENLK